MKEQYSISYNKIIKNIRAKCTFITPSSNQFGLKLIGLTYPLHQLPNLTQCPLPPKFNFRLKVARKPDPTGNPIGSEWFYTVWPYLDKVRLHYQIKILKYN